MPCFCLISNLQDTVSLVANDLEVNDAQEANLSVNVEIPLSEREENEVFPDADGHPDPLPEPLAPSLNSGSLHASEVLPRGEDNKSIAQSLDVSQAEPEQKDNGLAVLRQSGDSGAVQSGSQTFSLGEEKPLDAGMTVKVLTNNSYYLFLTI